MPSHNPAPQQVKPPVPGPVLGTGELVLADLRFRYGDNSAEMAFDLKARCGELVAILGPSGAGKSTLLNLIAGFASPSHGTMHFKKEDLLPLPPAQRPVTSLFQEHNLFAHLTVAQNVGLGLDPGLRLDEDQQRAVHQALYQVGLSGMNDRLPAALSGGQRQRVALARCLVRKKPILLLDEPFSALDQDLRREMLALIRQLHDENGLLTLMVTHLHEDAEAVADRILRLKDGHLTAANKQK